MGSRAWLSLDTAKVFNSVAWPFLWAVLNLALALSWSNYCKVFQGQPLERPVGFFLRSIWAGALAKDVPSPL